MKKKLIYFNAEKNHYIHAEKCPGPGYVIVEALPNFLMPHVPTDMEQRISELKELLASTDYQAIKFAEGAISEEQYAPIREQRQAWRNEINELENDGSK